MKLVYVGPHDAVEVPDAGIIARRDVPVEVKDDAQAWRLLEQRANWAKAVEEKPAQKSDKGGN